MSSDHVWGWCQRTQAPPYSTGEPFQCACQVRPPSRSRPSSSRTLRPRVWARRATTPVSVGLPADALRVLPDPGVSVREIREETLGDQVLDVPSPVAASS